MIKKKIKVFYDGSCKICNKEINFYHKNDKNNKFDWIDLNSQNENLRNLGIKKDDLKKSLHIEMEDGKILKGINAFSIIWREFKYFKYLSFFLDYKIVKIIARPTYNLLVRIKNFFS